MNELGGIHRLSGVQNLNLMDQFSFSIFFIEPIISSIFKISNFTHTKIVIICYIDDWRQDDVES